MNSMPFDQALGLSSMFSMFKKMIKILSGRVVCAGLIGLGALWGCSEYRNGGGSDRIESESSHLNFLITDELTSDNILAAIAKSRVSLIINNRTARSTVIKDGVVIDQWNSVVADISGMWHKVGGQPNRKDTPPGIYTVDSIEYCPSWYPAKIKDYIQVEHSNENQSGRRNAPPMVVQQMVTPNDDRYWEIIDQRLHIHGPCGNNNPLGHHILWFEGPYGFHGTTKSAEYLLNAPLEDRRASGGCIRNPRHKISRLFESIIEIYELDEFRQKVIENQHKVHNYLKAETIAYDANKDLDFNVRVIVGSFKKDLPFNSKDSQYNTVRLLTKAHCRIPSANVPIYDAPIFNNVIGHYQIGEMVPVFNYREREGVRTPLQTDKGWILRYYGSNCEESHRWQRYYIPTLASTTLNDRMTTNY